MYLFICICILYILISRPFEITTFVFTLPFESYCPKVFELSLVTIIIILTPVSYDYATSFNNDCKKVRDVGLPCIYHLSNIMPDSIPHESTGQRYLFFCFVCFAVVAVSFLFFYGCFP